MIAQNPTTKSKNVIDKKYQAERKMMKKKKKKEEKKKGFKRI
jgi:hypothetical protein